MQAAEGIHALLVSGILHDHLTAAEGRRTAMRVLPFSRLLFSFSRLLFLHRVIFVVHAEGQSGEWKLTHSAASARRTSPCSPESRAHVREHGRREAVPRA
jgi:hypothetical protein